MLLKYVLPKMDWYLKFWGGGGESGDISISDGHTL